MPGDTKKNTKKRPKSVGQKRPFTQEQVQLLRALLRERKALRDLALMEVAICTCLRASDLLKLRVDNVLHPQAGAQSPVIIYDAFNLQQKKTGRTVHCELSQRAREAVQAWLGEMSVKRHLTGETRLFTMTRIHYGRLVKGWAALLGLDTRFYSTHSMRRTQPAHLYAKTGDVRSAGELLGHRNVANTGLYLGIDTASAQRLRKEHEV